MASVRHPCPRCLREVAHLPDGRPSLHYQLATGIGGQCEGSRAAICPTCRRQDIGVDEAGTVAHHSAPTWPAGAYVSEQAACTGVGKAPLPPGA